MLEQHFMTRVMRGAPSKVKGIHATRDAKHLV